MKLHHVSIIIAIVVACTFSGHAFYGDHYYAPCANEGDISSLFNSSDMPPSFGSVEVNVPIDVLYDFFIQPTYWPKWNHAFKDVLTSSLTLCDSILSVLNPVNPKYHYLLPTDGLVIAFSDTPGQVSWQIDLPGFFDLHTYTFEQVDYNITRFRYWEKAAGSVVHLFEHFWVDQFNFVGNSSLAGVQYLEQDYQQYGVLNGSVVGGQYF